MSESNWLRHTHTHRTQQYKITFSIIHSLSCPYAYAFALSFWNQLTRHLLRISTLFILIWYNLIHYNPVYVSGERYVDVCACVWVSEPSIRNNSKFSKSDRNYIHPLGNGIRQQNHSTQDFTQQCVSAVYTD